MAVERIEGKYHMERIQMDGGVFLCPLPCGFLLMGILPLRLFRGAGLSLPFGLRRHRV